MIQKKRKNKASVIAGQLVAARREIAMLKRDITATEELAEYRRQQCELCGRALGAILDKIGAPKVVCK